MWWQAVLVVSAAVLSWFIPTSKDVRERFDGGQNLYAASAYQRAIEQYEGIINTKSALMDIDSVHVTIMSGELTIGVIAASYYQKANALRQLKLADSAIAVYRIVENLKDEPVLAALSQFQIYDMYYSQKKYQQAIADARKLVEKYPQSKKSEAALYDIAWANREMQNLTASNDALEELIQKYPQTEFYSKALYQLGQNNFELKQYDSAIAHWRMLGYRFRPDSFKEQEWEKVQLKAVKERAIFEASSQRETDASTLELVAKSQVKIGDCFREKKMYDSSMASYRKVITSYTLLPQIVEVSYNKMADYTRTAKGLVESERVYRSAIDENFAHKDLQAKFQYKIAEMYHNDSKFARAAEEYEFYVSAYADVAEAINFSVEDAKYSRIICLFNADKYPLVTAETDSFSVSFPGSNYDYDLKYLSALSHYQLKEYAFAKSGFTEVIGKKAEGLHAVPSEIYIGRIYLDTKKEEDAAGHFRSLLARFGETKYGNEIRYYAIQALYERRQYDTIPVLFSSMIPGTQFFTSTIIKASKSLILRKKLAEAETFIKRVVAVADSMKDSVNFKPEAYFAYADFAIAANRYEEGLKYLNTVVEEPGTNDMLKLQSRYLRGTLYGQAGKNKESIADLESVLANPVFLDKFKPMLANARGRLATAYTKTGQLQRGVDMMEKCIAESPDTLEKARYLVALAEVFFENRNYDRLIPLGERVIEMDVKDDFLYSRAVYLTATAYNSKNNLDKALAMFSRSVEKYPELNQDVFFNFGVNLYDMQYYKNAAAALSKYVEKYPKSPSARNAQFFTAYAFNKIGDWDKSVDAFRNFIKLYPADSLVSEAQYNIAEARYNEGNFAEAVKEYQVLYTAYPKSEYAPAGLYNQAWCSYKLKDVDRMIVPLQKLIDSYPQSQLVPEAQYTIGDYYYNKKEYSKALVEYRRFIEKFPNHAKTEEARSFIKELSQIDAFREYQKAIVIFDKKEWQKAIDALAVIVNNYPETEVSMACEANIGSAYEQLNQQDKALTVFREIVRKYKDNPLGSGVVYFAQQHIEWIEGNVASGK